MLSLFLEMVDEVSMPSRDDVFAYVKEKYKTDPDYPWGGYPKYAVLRHADTEKWYCLVMNVPRSKLGIAGEGEIDILDVKCRVEMVGALRRMKGIFPAYHMNKENWVTVQLGDIVSAGEVFRLIDESFELTR